MIELGCANPAQPCGLPNDFASDPDLKQVVARTVEIGVRGNRPDQRLTWSADAIPHHQQQRHPVRRDQHQSGSLTMSADPPSGARPGTGRKGRRLELARRPIVSSMPPSSRTFEVNADSNSTADANGNILVRPGDRIPLIPRHAGRLVLDYDSQPAMEHRRYLVAALRLVSAWRRKQCQRAGAPTARAPRPRLRMDSRLCGRESSGHLPSPHDRCVRPARQCAQQAIRHRRLPDQQCVQSERLLPLRSRCLDQ